MKAIKVFGFTFIGVGILLIIGTLIFSNENTIPRGDNVPFVNNWMHVLSFLLIATGVVFLWVFKGKK